MSEREQHSHGEHEHRGETHAPTEAEGEREEAKQGPSHTDPLEQRRGEGKIAPHDPDVEKLATDAEREES